MDDETPNPAPTPSQGWTCAACTFLNSHGACCVVCYADRPGWSKDGLPAPALSQNAEEPTMVENDAADQRRLDEEASAELARQLNVQEVAEDTWEAAAVAAEQRRLEAEQRREAEAARRQREEEEERSELLLRELLEREAARDDEQSAALMRRLQMEEDEETVRRLQSEEEQPPRAHAPSAAAVSARSDEASNIQRHLFLPSQRLTGGAEAAGGELGRQREPGRSYANAANAASSSSEWPRNVHASAPAPAISLPLPRRPPSTSTPAPQRPQLVIDGANVGWAYAGANGANGFDARGVRLCVDYWSERTQRRGAVAVVLHARYYSADDADLDALEARGVLCWAPAGHDDDLFMLQLAADSGAWLVSEDRYRNHRDVMASGLTQRLIPYMWAGYGSPKEVFTPKAGAWTRHFASPSPAQR